MEPIERLKEGNRHYLAHGNDARRMETAINGQHPYAVVICCSDSRVIPEQIFGADVGDLFVIRVAGNVLDRHQLGSIEYALSHLGCRLVVLLGHTNCGAVAAALNGCSDGYISFITDEIRKAIGMERDPLTACRLNVTHGAERIRRALKSDLMLSDVEVVGAVYDIRTGLVEWLPENEPADRRTI